MRSPDHIKSRLRKRAICLLRSVILLHQSIQVRSLSLILYHYKVGKQLFVGLELRSV